jgi:hypothetical protein
MALVLPQGIGTYSMTSLDRKFFQDEQQNQQCYLTAVGGERISIIYRNSALHQPPQVFVESLRNGKAWKQINPQNLPEELQDRFSSALKTLIKTAEFRVNENDEGDCKIFLETNERTKLVAQRFIETQILKREMQTVDGRLSNVPMKHFVLNLDAGDFIIPSIVASVTGVMVGFGTSIGISICASKGIVGAVALAGVGGQLAFIPFLVGTILAVALSVTAFGITIYVDGKQGSAENIKVLITEARDCYEQTQIAYNRQDEAAVKNHVDSLMSHLKTHKFVKNYDSYLFEFDEVGFKKMKNFYAKKDQKQVCAMMKLLILFSLELLPQSSCPLPSLVKCLENVDMNDIPLELRSHVLLAKGRLYMNRNDMGKGLENFQNIAENSDSYDLAQNYIRVINSFMPQQPQGLLT